MRSVRRIVGLLCGIFAGIFVACACNTDNQILGDTVQNYYTKDDFETIIIGESTYHDVYEIAPDGVMQVTSYGGMCKYPAKDGYCINIKFYGSELVVGSIDVEEGQWDGPVAPQK